MGLEACNPALAGRSPGGSEGEAECEVVAD